MAELGQPAWCAQCRRFRTVEDSFSASEMHADGEYEYGVVCFEECGHQSTSEPFRVGASPGAPYAGVRGFATYSDFTRRHLHPGTETDL